MKDRPLVSISCITYNHAPYIRQCLDGFIMQKTNFEYEVLIHDDASNDGTTAIICEYEERYPDKIKPIYEKENQWILGRRGSQVFNIPRANGKYIAICEGDDYWIDPYKLQKQVDFLETHPDYVACFHNARVFNGKSYRLFNDINENHFPTTEDLIIRHWFISTPTLVYRNIIQSYPSWATNVVNVDFLLELLLAREGRFYYMDDAMAVYRQQGQGLSAKLNARKLDMYDKLVFLLSNMKELYEGKYAESFNQSIANYEKEKKFCERELFYTTHPSLQAFRPKTYKRLIKNLLRKYV